MNEPAERPAVEPPLSLVVMGVTGTGKSSVAAGIAHALGLACIDGDDLHTPENVAKMRGGTPLTDDDRWPWLDRVGARLCGATAAAPAPTAPGRTAASGTRACADGASAGEASAGEASAGEASAIDASAGDVCAEAASTVKACAVAATAVRRGTVVSCSALKRAYRDRLRSAVPGLCFVFLHGAPELIRTRMLARRDHYMPPGLLESQLNTLQRPGADEPDVVALNIDAPLPTLIGQAVAMVRTRATARDALATPPTPEPPAP